MINLTLKPTTFHGLLSGQITEVMHEAADGDNRSGIEGVDYGYEYRDLDIPKGTSEFVINGSLMVLEVTSVSCYDSDPEHCPCCSWETWSFRKV